MDIVETCRSAWNATKKPTQPAYDELTEAYHGILAQQAAGAVQGQVSDGPFASFDAQVYRETRPRSEVAKVDDDDKPLQGKLPEDFPHRTLLEAEGINTYAQLRKAGDLTELVGIGAARAADIEAAMK